MLTQTPIQTIQTNAIAKHKLFLVATDTTLQQRFPHLAEACLSAISEMDQDIVMEYGRLLEEKLTGNFLDHDHNKLKRTGA
jgi:hypothetical protein